VTRSRLNSTEQAIFTARRCASDVLAPTFDTATDIAVSKVGVVLCKRWVCDNKR